MIPEYSAGIFRRRPYSTAEDSPAGVPLRATGVSPTIEESWALLQVAKESPLILEVGTAWGYSAILMGLAGATVYTVDPHTDHGTWAEFQRNRASYGLEERIVAYRETSQAALPRFVAEGAQFDAAFIDGDHSYEACRHDLGYALQLVRPGGIIAAHDYTSAWDGVWAACNELLGDLDPRRVVDTLLIVGRPGGSAWV